MTGAARKAIAVEASSAMDKGRTRPWPSANMPRCCPSCWRPEPLCLVHSFPPRRPPRHVDACSARHTRKVLPECHMNASCHESAWRLCRRCIRQTAQECVHAQPEDNRRCKGDRGQPTATGIHDSSSTCVLLLVGPYCHQTISP